MGSPDSVNGHRRETSVASGATPDERRALARQAMAGGRLPTRPPDRAWGGRGDGAWCALCDAPITGGEMEMEVEFVRDARGSDSYRLHVPCCSAWLTELGAGPSAGESGGVGNGTVSRRRGVQAG